MEAATSSGNTAEGFAKKAGKLSGGIIYGVKALIRHPEDDQKILMVKYRPKDEWTIPGWTYDPRKRESPRLTLWLAMREIMEVNVLFLEEFAIHSQALQGVKISEVVIFSGTIINPEEVVIKSEFGDFCWIDFEAMDNKALESPIPKQNAE